jgi:hypothetical protein
VGKKWSIKISQLAPANKEDKKDKLKPVSEPKAPEPKNSVTQPQVPDTGFSEIKKLMQTPGALINFGKGDTPVFNKPLSGAEFAKLVNGKQLSEQAIFDSIKSSLNRQGFNENINYSAEQLKAFQNQLNSDLIYEYSDILKLLNGDLFK